MLSIIQSLMLSTGQMALKIAIDRIEGISWTWKFVAGLAYNWWLALSGLLCGGATILWLYILKKYPFSMAYPMGSLSYIFALILAMFVLKENVSWNRWLGVGFVMLGCFFVAGK